MTLLGMALLMAVSHAQSPDLAQQAAWEALYDAKLELASGTDPEAVHLRLQNLVRSELRNDDPALSEAFFELGRLRWQLGRIDGARDALDSCVALGRMSAACLDLRLAIDLEQSGIREVPMTWDFSSTDHGVFHPRAVQELGGLSLEQDDAIGSSVLVWETMVSSRKTDRLVVGMDLAGDALPELTFRVSSTRLNAVLHVVLIAADGREWRSALSTLRIPAALWSDVALPLESFKSVAPDDVLRPDQLVRMELRDVTMITGRSGANAIKIDDFSLRYAP